jgi:hypothetical protein
MLSKAPSFPKSANSSRKPKPALEPFPPFPATASPMRNQWFLSSGIKNEELKIQNLWLPYPRYLRHPRWNSSNYTSNTASTNTPKPPSRASMVQAQVALNQTLASKTGKQTVNKR